MKSTVKWSCLIWNIEDVCIQWETWLISPFFLFYIACSKLRMLPLVTLSPIDFKLSFFFLTTHRLEEHFLWFNRFSFVRWENEMKHKKRFDGLRFTSFGCLLLMSGVDKLNIHEKVAKSCLTTNWRIRWKFWENIWLMFKERKNVRGTLTNNFAEDIKYNRLQQFHPVLSWIDAWPVPGMGKPDTIPTRSAQAAWLLISEKVGLDYFLRGFFSTFLVTSWKYHKNFYFLGN